MRRLRVGDLVTVISGREKGKQGRISRLLADRDAVIVEGVNVVTRHQRPTARDTQGGKITKEAPLHASKVMPIDPATGKATRVSRKKDDKGAPARDDKGQKTRLAKSGQALGSE